MIFSSFPDIISIAVRLEPTANGLTVIGGRNGQGKTSVLDAIAWALGGNKFRPTEPQRDGSVIPPHLKITLDNVIIVERSGSMGSKHADTMKFWTAEEFDRVDKAVSDKPLSHALLNLLFWSGMREGEALALTLNDIDFENNKISITKTFTVLKGGVEAITPPKTKKSKREIDMPVFCMDIIKEYSKLIYGLKKKDRLFPVTKSYLYHELERGSALAGLQKIRVHDLRHSHASVLINMGVSILLISERLGHENIETTLRTYSHLYPTTIQTTIRQLEKLHDDVVSQSQDKQNTYSKTVTNQITAM